MSANDRQVDGTHYKDAGPVQHWDWALGSNLNYFAGAASKYIARWKRKHDNGLVDLGKAEHYIEKKLEGLRSVSPPDSVEDFLRGADGLDATQERLCSLLDAADFEEKRGCFLLASRNYEEAYALLRNYIKRIQDGQDN